MPFSGRKSPASAYASGLIRAPAWLAAPCAIVSVIARSSPCNASRLGIDDCERPRPERCRGLQCYADVRNSTAWQRTTSPTGCSSPDPGWTICAQRSRRARRGLPARTSGPSPSRAGIRRNCWRTWRRWFRTGWHRSSGSSRATRNRSRSGGSRPTRSGSRRSVATGPCPSASCSTGSTDRTELVARRLGELSVEQIERRGTHPTRGEMTVGAIVERMLINHIDEHVEQLGSILGNAPERG